MKNTLQKAGLTVLLGMSLVGCSIDDSEPKPEQYRDSTLQMEVPRKGLLIFTDFDNDGLVDNIYNSESGIKLYVAKGYEGRSPGRYEKDITRVMDENFRERISQPFKGLQNVGYLMADERFKSRINK